MTGRQDVFQQAMNQGHSAAWDQMWDKAAAFYRQALEEMPDHPQALTNLGLALFELQEYEESLRTYKRAAQVLPNDPIPMEKVAQLYERTGSLDSASLSSLQAAELYLKNRDANKAIENWQRVTRLKPDNIQAHSRLALVWERMGEKEKAVQSYLAVASLLQAAGDQEKAAKAISQALQVMPNSTEVITALEMLRDGKALPRPERPRGGTAPLRMSQVRKLQPPRRTDDLERPNQDPIIEARQRALTVLAGMLFDGADDSDEALGRRGLSSIVSGSTNLALHAADRSRIILHLSQVVDAQSNNSFGQAAEELEKAIEAGLDHPAAYYDLGYLHAQSGRTDSALKYLQSAQKQLEFALGARLLMAEILRKMNQRRAASLEYLQALRLADAEVVLPEYADDLRQLYEPLIDAYQRQNDTELQNRLIENIAALLMRPNWREQVLRAREQLPARAGAPMPLAEILTEARSSHIIDSISYIYELANRGDLRAAMEEAFYALQQAPTYLPLHTYMGELLLKQGHTQDAIAKFMVVARSYTIRGEPHKAVELYRRVIEMAPMDMNARTRLIEQLIGRSQIEDAIQEYMRLADVYYSLADLDMVRKTYTEALRLAQQSKVDRSWRVQIMHRMADIDLQSLDWRQALRVFEQIRTLQPDDEKARSSLVELNFRLGQDAQAVSELNNFLAYLDSSRQGGRAISFVEGLLLENPERLVLRQRLADLYRRSGRNADAIREMDLIGEALLTAGDSAGAVQIIEGILALNPPKRADYQQLLVQLRGR